MGEYSLADLTVDDGLFGGGGQITYDLTGDPCSPDIGTEPLDGTVSIDSFEGDTLVGSADLGPDVLGGTFEATPCTFPYTF